MLRILDDDFEELVLESPQGEFSEESEEEHDFRPSQILEDRAREALACMIERIAELKESWLYCAASAAC